MKKKLKKITNYNNNPFILKLNTFKNTKDIKTTQKFFKFGKNNYTNINETFIGISSPILRKTIKESIVSFTNNDIFSYLFQSNIHEYKLVAIIGLVLIYENPLKYGKHLFYKQESIITTISTNIDNNNNENERNNENNNENIKNSIKRNVLEFYLKHIKYMDNWDLVDTGCYKILGKSIILFNNDLLLKIRRKYNSNISLKLFLQENLPLYYSNLLFSDNFWFIRIAIVSLLSFKNDYNDISLLILKYIINDLPNKSLKINNEIFYDYDLIYKSIGWVLRECGKKNHQIIIDFLRENHTNMAKISIRYAIEHLRTKPDFLT